MTTQPVQLAAAPSRRSTIERVLVPLDGSDVSEAVVLPYIEQIASATNACITLVNSIYIPTAWTEFLAQIDIGKEVDTARTYLQDKELGLKERGLKAETRIRSGPRRTAKRHL